MIQTADRPQRSEDINRDIDRDVNVNIIITSGSCIERILSTSNRLGSAARENTEITVIYGRGGRPRATMEGENRKGKGRKAESRRDREGGGEEGEGSRYRMYGLRSH